MYWENELNDSDNTEITEILVGGDITVVEILKVLNANLI